MNGIRNLAFIVLLMVILVATEYTYTIGDKVVNGMNGSNGLYQRINATFPNAMTDRGLASYQNMRSLMYTAITGVMVPFLIFLSLMSSAINRNQTLGSYLMNAMVIIIATPIFIYLTSEIITNMTNITILDSAYLASTYISNILYIMVANMLLTLASFVFVKKDVTAL